MFSFVVLLIQSFRLVSGPINGLVGQLAAHRLQVALNRRLPIGEWPTGHQQIVAPAASCPPSAFTDRLIALMALIG